MVKNVIIVILLVVVIFNFFEGAAESSMVDYSPSMICEHVVDVKLMKISADLSERAIEIRKEADSKEGFSGAFHMIKAVTMVEVAAIISNSVNED